MPPKTNTFFNFSVTFNSNRRSFIYTVFATSNSGGEEGSVGGGCPIKGQAHTKDPADDAKMGKKKKKGVK